MIIVTLVTVFLHNLALAVLVGVIISALAFAWENARRIRARKRVDENGVKHYDIYGPLFFGSTMSFLEKFDYKGDDDAVIIDFEESRVADQSGIDAIKKVNEKYKEADIISVGLNKFSQLFKATEPNIIVVLGDRYELFSAVLSAFFLKITLAHIHGGEKTVGALDDSIRHAITKLSHIHFVSNKAAKKVLINSGEGKDSIFITGSPDIDLLNKSLIHTA